MGRALGMRKPEPREAPGGFGGSQRVLQAFPPAQSGALLGFQQGSDAAGSEL